MGLFGEDRVGAAGVCELGGRWNQQARARPGIGEALVQGGRLKAENTNAQDAHGQRSRRGVVSSGCFNARLPDTVQLGGIFTPREERSRGHARKLVAGMLRVARDEGATRGVLFTNDDNVAAIRAYTALGFQRVGNYGLVLWSP